MSHTGAGRVASPRLGVGRSGVSIRYAAYRRVCRFRGGHQRLLIAKQDAATEPPGCPRTAEGPMVGSARHEAPTRTVGSTPNGPSWRDPPNATPTTCGWPATSSSACSGIRQLVRAPRMRTSHSQPSRRSTSGKRWAKSSFVGQTSRAASRSAPCQLRSCSESSA